MAQTFYEALSINVENQRFRGYTTRVYKDAGLPITHYTRTKTILEEMGCIVVEVKGNRSNPSVWWLVTKPTEELYRETSFTWGDSKYQKLIERIEVLEQQMKGLLTNGEGTT